jgi:hypothetical protein
VMSLYRRASSQEKWFCGVQKCRVDCIKMRPRQKTFDTEEICDIYFAGFVNQILLSHRGDV